MKERERDEREKIKERRREKPRAYRSGPGARMEISREPSPSFICIAAPRDCKQQWRPPRHYHEIWEVGPPPPPPPPSSSLQLSSLFRLHHHRRRRQSRAEQSSSERERKDLRKCFVFEKQNNSNNN